MEGNKPLFGPEDFARIIQIGVVVEDLDHAIEGMHKVFGVEPSFTGLMDYPWVIYRDRDVDAKVNIACYNQFGVQLEFMEPVGEADSIWKDHLKECQARGHSLHHLRFNDVDDNDRITKIMEERGIKRYQEGASIMNPGGRFTYYDTINELGFIIEIATKVQEG